MSKPFLFTGAYGSYNVTLDKGLYYNGNLAIRALCIDGSPAFTATVNLDEVLPNGYVYIKNYSENEGVLTFLMNLGIVTKIIRYVQSGYVSIPVCQIDMSKLNEYT
jgi:hypothetical protein